MANTSTSPSKLRNRLYQEIVLESQADRRWSCKIVCPHTFSHILPSYLQYIRSLL